jgi:hypothetical protein
VTKIRALDRSLVRAVVLSNFQLFATMIVKRANRRPSPFHREANAASAPTTKGRGCSNSTRCTVPVPMPSVLPIFNVPVPPKNELRRARMLRRLRSCSLAFYYAGSYPRRPPGPGPNASYRSPASTQEAYAAMPAAPPAAPTSGSTLPPVQPLE